MTRALVITALIAALLPGMSDRAGQDPSSVTRVTEGTRLNMVYTSTQYSANPPDRGPCDAPRWVRVRPSTWTKKLIAGLVRCAVKRWSVPGGAAFAVRVFDCESGLYPWAIGGDNLGVAQHKARYWLGRVNAYLHRDWFSAWQWKHVHQEASVDNPHPAFNARANVIAGIKMAHSGGWGPWACA